MLVIVQQQPEDREKHFEGGWCVGYGQVNVKDPNPTINFVDAQLGGFVEKVRWDRIRRVTILEPIDPKIDSNDKSGERESYRIN